MSNFVVPFKENGGETTPLQNRRTKTPASVGKSARSFGTPLAANTTSTLSKSATTSKKVQVRQSSSKKVVRARKLVQQHRTPSRGSPPQTTKSSDNDNYNAFTYTVTFLPGSMGLQMEPAQGLLGCKVNAFADKGPANPGQARLSNMIRPGDVVLEMNDENVSHMTYNDIVENLKQQAQMPKKMLFRSAPPSPLANNNNMNSMTTPQPRRSFALNATGALTPMISPPHSGDIKKSISSVLFMDPASVTPLATTVSVPSSPTYSPQQQSNDVVVDVQETCNESIDTSSILSPSKIKNLSQEDLELGLGEKMHMQSNRNINRKPLANVFRTVYNSVMVGRVGSFGATNNTDNKMPFKEDGPTVSIPVAEKEMEESFQKKSQLVQNLNQVSMVVDDIYFDIEQKQDDFNGRTTLEEEFKGALDQLQKVQSEEVNRVDLLEQQLQTANVRVAELTANLESKQSEIDFVTHGQMASQTDLEHKLREAHTEIETLSQQRSKNVGELQKEVHEARVTVQQIAKEKDEALASLEAILVEVKEVRAKTESQKNCQLEAQLQVAKLQTELRDYKKENEILASDATENQTFLRVAEETLKRKEKELGNNKYTMAAYEEKIVERETEFDTLQEEKEFAGRELNFARSEIQLLKESLSTKEQEQAEIATGVTTERRCLQENVNMAQKELADLKQLSFDREHELQTQLTQCNSELEKLKQQSVEATNREQSLEISLQQRDEDLIALNQAINTNLATMKDQLQEKAKSLKDNLTLLDKTETDKDNLLNEVAGLNLQCKGYSKAQSELQTTIQQRDLELESKEDELSSMREAIVLLQHGKDNIEKDAKELKNVANEMFQEKSRITKDLQVVKVELSDAKTQATKIQDSLLQRAKQLESKVKEAQGELKTKDQALAAAVGKLDQATEKVDALTTEVKTRDIALVASSAKLQSLEVDCGNSVERENQLKAELSEKHREIKTVMEDSRGTKAKILEASNTVSALQLQISIFESARSVSEQETAALQEEMHTFNIQIESQRQTLDNNALELASKSSEVLALQTTVENLRDDLEQRRDEINESEKGLVAAQAQYTQLHERFTSAASESSEKLQGLTANLIAAQDETADNLTTRSKLERQVLHLSQQAQDRDEQLSEIGTKLEAATLKVGVLENSCQKAKLEADTKISELFDEITNESASVHQLEEDCLTQTRENVSLKQELASLVKRLAGASFSFDTEKQNWESKHALLESHVSSSKLELSNLTEQHAEVLSEMASIEKKLKETEITCEDQLAILRNDVTSKDKQIIELSSKKDESAAAIFSCREELSVAKLESQRLEESRTLCQNELTNLNSLLESQRSDHLVQMGDLGKRHKDETTKLTKDRHGMETAMRKADSMRATLLTKLDKAENMIDEEREKNGCLTFEQESLELSLHRAEDLAADLQCAINILKEEQADQSIDSTDAETLALSKSELRTKCKSLSEDIQEAEIRAASGASSVSQKQSHIRRLEADMAELSAELGNQVESSDRLEAALLKARMDKADTEASAEDLRTSIDAHHTKTQALKQELDQQYQENSELLDQVRDLQSQQKQSNGREDGLQEELDNAKQSLELLDQKNAKSENEMAKVLKELAEMTQQREVSQGNISDLEFQIAQITDELSTCEKQKELMSSDLQRSNERFEEQVRELRNENSEFKSAVANLESQVETHLSTIQGMEEAQFTFQEKLEKQRAYGVKMGGLREEAVSKLAEASRVLAAQKGMISVQEARATEAEENAKKLSAEVETLQETIKTMESEMEDHGMLRSSQLEEMEKKRANLEKARLNAKAEADLLRDEVRQANRRATELDRINKSLQTKIEELKTTAESTKAQMREARGAWTESDNLSRNLENDLQSSRAEIDHLRAKLQLCGATIKRLKTDRLLLQEAVAQAETNGSNGESNSLTRELSKVRSELHTKAAQLSSASTSLRNYKQICTEMKTTEKELAVFIEDIIVRADRAFNELSDISTQFTDQKLMDEAYSKCCMNFASIVQQASSELEGKRSKLLNWRENHSSNTTPTKKKAAGEQASLLSPTESSVQRVFGRMKEVLGNNQEHPRVESVLVSLEFQIDALCEELRSANSALREKDTLFATLQQQSTESMAPRKLSSIEEGPEETEDQQKQIAHRQLSQQLETTRSKISQLRNLGMKKTKAGSPASSDNQQT